MTNRRLAAPFLAIFLTLTVSTASAQTDPCPCVPRDFVWTATACETWNCAQASMILAGGDPYVLAAPTASNDYKWVVLRRVLVGSAAVPPDAPFTVETFDSMSAATARFSAADSDTHPMLLTTLDGKALVVALRNPESKRRAAGR